ncbi:catalase [Actinophytocola sp. NPDC049390]|uniref:catalase n=1 Tax=Actinophytocola sp. NPDC049390 TaxID=3363894 RepID=UPI0037899031
MREHEREAMTFADREVVPERRMHAKGSGAFGRFTVTHDISRYTKAALFDRIGNECETFVRFSTVAGKRGAADAERGIRGFAVRFYTSQGNWDLVGNNTPVFFHRDPLKFPDLSRAVKRDPRTNTRDPENSWGFWTNLPESLHQVTIIMSDRGIPKSYRHMHGFGSHTFSLVNATGERHWVKFHHRTRQGIQNLTDAEAAEIIGADRESHHRDLYEAIERGEFPKWTLYVQVMPEADARNYRFHPFDLTKVWRKADYPLIEVGKLELNRNPENYFADVEQAALTLANLVPGIGVPGVEPDNVGRWAEQPWYGDPGQVVGSVADHFDFREDDDYFQQPGDLFRLMDEEQRRQLFENTARAIKGARRETVERHIANCGQADPAYGAGVRKACEAIGAL